MSKDGVKSAIRLSDKIKSANDRWLKDIKKKRSKGPQPILLRKKNENQ